MVFLPVDSELKKLAYVRSKNRPPTTPVEVEQAKISSRTLSKYADVGRVQLVLRGCNGESDDLFLPSYVLQILLDVLSEMSKDNVISLSRACL